MISWQIKAATALVAILGAGYAGHIFTHNHWQAKWAERDANDALQLAQAQAMARKTEHEWRDKQEAINNEYQKLRTEKAAADRQLDDVGERLRLALQSRTSRTTEYTSPIAERAAAATDRLLLAELFRSADERAGALAKLVGESRLAGLQCQQEYNSLRDYHVKQTKR
jgi:Fe-S cluster assembly scaffold protein SufB